MLDEEYLDSIFESFTRTLKELGAPLPSVSLIAEEDSDPYRVLVSTVISLRTKDSVTLDASKRLFMIAPDARTLAETDIETIAEAIKPAGFYKRKAEQLKKTASLLVSEHDGQVPSDMDALMALPGVGLKTASLVLNLGFGIDAVCVDCHVHEIVNRLGWVSAKTPEKTEEELRRILPRRFWIPLNELLVRYGQYVCLPVSPRCSLCPVCQACPKTGVGKHR